MKHIALFLAIVIFALSLVSCSDLTYYKGAGWTCKQEDFYNNHYEPTREKVVEVIRFWLMKVILFMKNLYID